MTEVAFHFNAADPLHHICRLLRKAVGSGARVVVTGEPRQLRDLDTALWSFSALDFIAHCDADAGTRMVAASPVLLTQRPDEAPHHQVLVNLGAPVPEGFERFERLIEVVGVDEDDRIRARSRWKHYADRGYPIVRHDLANRSGAP